MAADPTSYRLTGQRSQVIHGAGCRILARAKHSVGWSWADGKTPEQIASDKGPTSDRLRFCRVCCPGAEIQEWQEPRCAKPGCGLPRSDRIHLVDHNFHPEGM
jgi:hypothetical protein